MKKNKNKKRNDLFFILTIFFVKCAMVKSFKAFFILLTISIPLKFDYKDILKKVICDINSRNCILHLRENCPELDGVTNFMTNFFIENYIDNDEGIIYMQWISTDRTTMKKLTSFVDKYIALLVNKVFALCALLYW